MFSIQSRKMNARRMYLIVSTVMALSFAMTFGAVEVYKVQTVGLSALQLVLVGTVLEVSIFLFEIPTGIVADVYSRRLSMVIGLVLIGAGFMLEGSTATFGAVLGSQVLWGIGYTFTSGATQAWITDEVGEEDVGVVFMRGSQLANLGGIAGTISAILLGSLFIQLPIVLGGALMVGLALFMVLFMPETGFKPTPSSERSTWRQMGETLRGGVRVVRGRPTLTAILFIGLFFGLYSEGFDRLNAAHLLESFTLPDLFGLQPVAWMGIMGIVGGLLATLALRLVEKRLDMRRARALARALFGVSGLLVFSLLLFGLAEGFWVAVICGWLVGIARTLIGPIEATWMNQYIDSNVRATVISMRSQVDAFGQMAGGPPLGFVGERLGIRAALVASAVLLSPVLYLFARLLRNGMPDGADGATRVQASAD